MKEPEGELLFIVSTIIVILALCALMASCSLVPPDFSHQPLSCEDQGGVMVCERKMHGPKICSCMSRHDVERAMWRL